MISVRFAAAIVLRTAVLLFCIGLGAATTSLASPATLAYPDTDGYTPVSNVEIYKLVDEAGVWFTSPLGLHCAIEDDGSYGCSGELAGVPAGDNEVAWFVGDPFPRLYHAAEPRFSAPASQMVLIRLTSISYRGSLCAVTADGAVYCIHRDNPDSQMMATANATLRGPAAMPAI